MLDTLYTVQGTSTLQYILVQYRPPNTPQDTVLHLMILFNVHEYWVVLVYPACYTIANLQFLENNHAPVGKARDTNHAPVGIARDTLHQQAQLGIPSHLCFAKNSKLPLIVFLANLQELVVVFSIVYQQISKTDFFFFAHISADCCHADRKETVIIYTITSAK